MISLEMLFYESVSIFNVGFKSLLHQGLSEPEFYSNLVYKFKKITGGTDFSYQIRKMINDVTNELAII